MMPSHGLLSLTRQWYVASRLAQKDGVPGRTGANALVITGG